MEEDRRAREEDMRRAGIRQENGVGGQEGMTPGGAEGSAGNRMTRQLGAGQDGKDAAGWVALCAARWRQWLCREELAHFFSNKEQASPLLFISSKIKIKN